MQNKRRRSSARSLSLVAACAALGTALAFADPPDSPSSSKEHSKDLPPTLLEQPATSFTVNEYLDKLMKSDQDLYNTLRNNMPRRENQSIVLKYYDSIRDRYLSDDYSNFVVNMNSGLASFKSGLKSAANDLDVDESIYKCIGTDNSSSFLKDINETGIALQSYGNELQGGFESVDFDYKRGSSLSRAEIQTHRGVLSNILAGELDMGCCKRVVDKEIKESGSNEKEKNDQRKAARGNCEEFAKSLQSLQARLLKSISPLHPIRRVPNPLDKKYGMDPDDLAVALSDIRTFNKLQASQSNGNEDTVLQDLSTCIKKAQAHQSASRPAGTAIAEALGKAIKCTMLPAVATYYFDTPWQKLTVAASGVPIQGDKWDISCDPSEVNMWLQMRETDPVKIQAQWGIPQMANPPWIAGLRQLPPITTPFPVIGVTAEDLIRMSPQSMYSLPDAIPVTPSTDPGSSRFGAPSGTGTSGGTRGTFSTSTSNTVNTSGSRFRLQNLVGTPSNFQASRGLTQAQAYTQVTRTASAQIQNGKSPQRYSGDMVSAARATRNFIGAAWPANASTKSLGVSRSQIAATARGLVTISAGSTASRTTTGQILNDISLLPSTTSTTTTLTYPNQTAIGQQLESIVNAHLNNLRFAMQEAEQIREHIAELLGQRDADVAKLAAQIVDKAPMKIADYVMNTQQQLLKLDSQIGALRAQYDVYAGSVRDQTMFIQRALTYGPSGVGVTNLPTVTNYPSNYPSAFQPSGTTTGTGTGLRGAFYNLMELLEGPQAWAASKPGGPAHWFREWNRFVQQYRDYNASVIREDEKNRVAVVDFLKDRKQRVESKPMDWMDTGTLVAAKVFMSTVNEESSYLLERNQEGALSLDSSTLENLKNSKAESEAAIGEVVKATQALIQTEAHSANENPEVWVGMLPGLVLF